MRNLLLVFVIVSSAWLMPVAVLACSCEFLTPQQKLEEGAFVFSGNVIDIEEEGTNPDEIPMLFTTFEVGRSWKGIDGSQVTVVSFEDSGANCGYRFEPSEEYLVYGFIADGIAGVEIETDSSPDLAEGHRMTNACQRPLRLAEAAADIEALDSMTVVRPLVWGRLKAHCQAKSDGAASPSDTLSRDPD